MTRTRWLLIGNGPESTKLKHKASPVNHYNRVPLQIVWAGGPEYYTQPVRVVAYTLLAEYIQADEVVPVELLKD